MKEEPDKLLYEFNGRYYMEDLKTHELFKLRKANQDEHQKLLIRAMGKSDKPETKEVPL